MTYQGHIENGRVVLDSPASLPEGAVVTIVLAEDDENCGHAVPPLSERFASVIGSVKSLPADAAENLDHYLYGLPKR